MQTGRIAIRVRAAGRRAWIYFLWCSGLLRFAEWRLARQGRTIVLTFHRVLREKDFDKTASPIGMLVREQTFDQLLLYLSRRYSTIRCSQVLSERKSQQLDFAITFDDGWQDNYTVAAAIASKHRVPLTVFLCPRHVGKELPFWPEQLTSCWKWLKSVDRLGVLIELFSQEFPSAPTDTNLQSPAELISILKRMPANVRVKFLHEMLALAQRVGYSKCEASPDTTMTWEQIRELRELGVEFGSHTCSHEILPNLPSHQAAREISESRINIEKELQCACELFSYPNGDWNTAVRNLVAAAGYRLAFVNNAGAWDPRGDSLVVPRVNIWEGAVVGPRNKFSRLTFRYVTLWKTYRSNPIGDAGPHSGMAAAALVPGSSVVCAQ